MHWKNIKNIQLSEISERVFHFLFERMRWIFLGMAILLTVSCCYLWYSYLYHSEWNEAKKQSYMRTKEADIAFDREKFDKFIRGADDRQMEFQKDLAISTDIFQLKK